MIVKNHILPEPPTPPAQILPGWLAVRSFRASGQWKACFTLKAPEGEATCLRAGLHWAWLRGLQVESATWGHLEIQASPRDVGQVPRLKGVGSCSCFLARCSKDSTAVRLCRLKKSTLSLNSLASPLSLSLSNAHLNKAKTCMENGRVRPGENTNPGAGPVSELH